MQRRPWIAVTGGIGEGKSTVLSALSDAGHKVASSDLVAHELFDDPKIQQKLEMLFSGGADVSKEGLRQAITTNPQLRREINRVFFPRILSRLEELAPAFVEVPLLCEACLQGAFSRVWVVTCGRDEQRRRLMARYGDASRVSGLIGSQLATAVKLAFADLIVRTNEPLQAVNAFVIQAAEREMER